MIWKMHIYFVVLWCGTQFISFGGSLTLLAPPKPDNKLIQNEELNHLLNESDGIREIDDFPVIPASNNSQSNDILHLSDNECPADSQLIDGRCTCLPCTPQTCNTTDAQLTEIESAKGTPGHCCAVSKCIKMSPCRSMDGDLIEHNSWWIENCQNCTCFNGLGFECFDLANCNQTTVDDNESKTCITNTGSLKLDGDTWSPDYCTRCTCENGDVKCIAHYCEENSVVKSIHPPTTTNTYECEPLNDCNLHCSYGLRTRDNCEICECALHSYIIDLAKQKNYSIDDIYMFIQLNNAHAPSPTVPAPSTPSGGQWTIFLSVAIVVLIVICCGLFWCLIRNMRLQNTKMDVVCKTHELKKLVNGQAYDAGLNATYKYTTTEYTK